MPQAASQWPLSCGHRLSGRARHLAFRNRNGILGKKLLGLILVQIHELSFNADLIA
jgi:hypothetical protein